MRQSQRWVRDQCWAYLNVGGHRFGPFYNTVDKNVGANGSPVAPVGGSDSTTQGVVASPTRGTEIGATQGEPRSGGTPSTPNPKSPIDLTPNHPANLPNRPGSLEFKA